MPALTANDREALRTLNHRNTVYASFLNPLELWEMEVDGAHARGSRLIAFRAGTSTGGPHALWAAVEPLQTAWVFRMDTPPLNPRITTDWATPVRIRSVSSGGGDGVTGILGVASNNIDWSDGQRIVITHDYRYDTMYPDIDPDTEEIYKDVDVPWPGVNEMIPPVVIAELSAEAQFIRDGRAVFWLDVSGSYAMAEGATIAGHTVSIYPNSLVTLSYDAGLDLYRIVCTDPALTYYWLKITVEDSNGTEQVSYRRIHTHNENPAFTVTHPHTDFEMGGLDGDRERGGWQTTLTLYDEGAVADITDGTGVLLWKENRWNRDAALIRTAYTDDNYLFVGGNIGYRTTGAGIEVEVRAGVFYGLDVAPDGTAFSVMIDYGGLEQHTLPAVVADGKITITDSYTGAIPSWNMNLGTYYDLATLVADTTYRRGRTQAVAEPIVSRLLAFPQTMLSGYVKRGSIIEHRERGEGYGTLEMELTTIDGLLADEFQFSIPVTATEEPGAWEEYPAYLTTSRAAHYFFRHHSKLMEVANVYGLADNTLPDSAVDFEPGTVWEMAQGAVRDRGIRAQFVVDKRGNVRLTPVVQLMRDSERAALPIVMTIEDEDKGGEWSVQREPWPRVALARASGIAWDGTTFVDVAVGDGETLRAGAGLPHCSLAPGDYPDRGGPEYALLDNQIVEDQEHVNELSGRLLARGNNAYPELTITFSGDYLDVLDIAEAELFFTLISRFDWLLGFDLGIIHLIPQRVEAEYEDGFLRVSASFEREADGPAGIEAGCPELPEDFDGGDGDYEIDPLPDTGGGPTEGDGLGTVFRMVDTVLARTSNLSASSPSWMPITFSATLGGVFQDWILDPWAPSSIGFLSTDNGIFRIDNVKSASPTIDHVLSLPDIASQWGQSLTVGQHWKIVGSINIEGFFFFMFVDANSRMICARTYDKGESWEFNDSGITTQGTPAINSLDILGWLPSGQPQIIAGLRYDTTGTGQNSGVFVSTNAGQSWSQKASYGTGIGLGQFVDAVSYPYSGNQLGNTFYATRHSNPDGSLADHHVFKTTNGGTSFVTVYDDAPIAHVSMRDLVGAHTFDTERVYFWDGSNSPPNMYLTENGGGTWETLPATGVTGLIRGAGGFPYNTGLFYISTTAGVWVTLNTLQSVQSKLGNWDVSWGHGGARHVVVPDWTE